MVINGLITLFCLLSQSAFASSIWMEIEAHTQKERSEIASLGFDIVSVESDRVIVLGSDAQLAQARSIKKVFAQYPAGMSPFDFPQKDEKFHNYNEMVLEMQTLAQSHSSVASLFSIGQTPEKRDIWMMRLSADATTKPAAVFMGGHHAREHVSVEVPLRLIGYLIAEYDKQNPRIVALLNTYEIFIAPLINPDGKEFDVATGSYKQWRKNRKKNADTSYGVDLNRNYGYGWGGVGASPSTFSETYRGPNAFSELETQAVKKWVEQTPQLTMLLSYHTFSKLVMWPWGHVDDSISNADDLLIFENMGKQMAQWNGYKPMKSGDLYLASGDTCDWAYGEHGIYAFTFELDPESPWEGGFYPGYGVVDGVFKKNIEPALYLIESADNPRKRM